MCLCDCRLSIYTGDVFNRFVALASDTNDICKLQYPGPGCFFSITSADIIYDDWNKSRNKLVCL